MRKETSTLPDSGGGLTTSTLARASTPHSASWPWARSRPDRTLRYWSHSTRKQRSLNGDRCSGISAELDLALLSATPATAPRLRWLRRGPEDNRIGAALNVQVQPFGLGGGLQTRAFCNWAVVLVEIEPTCPFGA